MMHKGSNRLWYVAFLEYVQWEDSPERRVLEILNTVATGGTGMFTATKRSAR